MTVFKIPQEESDESDELPEGAVRTEFEDIEDFNNYLDSYYKNLCDGDLHVVPGVTDLGADELIDWLSRLSRNWDIEEEYGAVTKLAHETENQDESHGAYFAKETGDDDIGYFIFYTDEPKTKYVDDVLIKDLRRIPQTNKLHVTPNLIERLVKRVTSKLPDHIGEEIDIPYVDEVHLKHKSGSQISSNLDSEKKRSVSFWGEDAASAIPVLRKEFGVLISSVRIKYPYSSGDMDYFIFKIDKNGVLKLKKGKLTDMLQEVKPIIEDTLNVKRAYDDTETSFVTIGDNETQISQSTPALIKPGKNNPAEDSQFSADEIQATFDALANRGYIPIDPYMESDPLYYSTTAYHREDQIYFDIRGDAEALRLFPRADQEKLETFFGVLRAIHNNADSSAMALSVAEMEGNE
ncbi:hypothetical protein [Natranaeroarchaeum aerophilus]|uniref:Uncharacterized protein n=1 Tax=Natranaeroarchaeum aerophilus TaxID=2917711 RepID=A0AAE3FVC8_9EURY|nr:hypothetical protein [Natranaeroarchaeum aerophilus]MCL9815284.1 hypothetical protein [Natranaeroarchaeum aerophilus]